MIAGVGRKNVEDLGVPRPSHEDPARGAVRCGYLVSHAEWQMLDPVRAIGRPHIGEIRSMLHLQVDDRDPHIARRFENRAGRMRCLRDPADVDAGQLEHAARRTEIVLHVDDHNSRSFRIDEERGRPRIQLKHAFHHMAHAESGAHLLRAGSRPSQ